MTLAHLPVVPGKYAAHWRDQKIIIDPGLTVSTWTTGKQAMHLLKTREKLSTAVPGLNTAAGWIKPHYQSMAGKEKFDYG
ncbi:hypothetical protein XL16_13395 [Salmonella enterica subsp. enterica serovar Gaminara]|nr:hypothetical protein [Salmonella enterica subsp. enterica serovar Gaminara]